MGKPGNLRPDPPGERNGLVVTSLYLQALRSGIAQSGVPHENRGVVRRNPAYQASSVEQQPLFSGDGVSLPPTNQYSWLPLTTLQYLQMQAWAQGNFEPGSPPPQVSSVEQLPLVERPASLDQAALDSVLGGANHPGVETPSVLRGPSMWESAYRLRIESTTVVVHNYGPM